MTSKEGATRVILVTEIFVVTWFVGSRLSFWFALVLRLFFTLTAYSILVSIRR